MLDDPKTLRVLDAIPDAVLVVSGDGTIEWANTRAEQVFHYPRAELVGRRVEHLLPEDLRAVHERHRQSYSAAPTARPMGRGMKLVACRKDGTRFRVEIALSPTPDGAHIMCVVRDLSEFLRV